MRLFRIIRTLFTFFCFFLSLLAAKSYAKLPVDNQFNKIVIFGDSLSDNGNLYKLTESLHQFDPETPVFPPTPPYYEGRFSNGLVWIEHLTNILFPGSSSALLNYAWGGAWVQADHRSLDLPLNLSEEVKMFIADRRRENQNKDNYLYVFWMGSNDYLVGNTDVETATKNTVAEIKKQIETLMKDDFKYYPNISRSFLILNIPNLGNTPRAHMTTPEYRENVTALSQTHNKYLKNMVDELNQEVQEFNRHQKLAIRFLLVDLAGKFDKIYMNKDEQKKYGISETQKACLNLLGNFTALNRTNSPVDIKVPEVTWRKFLEFHNLKDRKVTNPNANQSSAVLNLNIAKNPALKAVDLTSLPRMSICSPEEQDHYLFWDSIHPTRVMHKIIAAEVCENLKQQQLITPLIGCQKIFQ